MKIVVTGGTGFIGSHLAKFLVSMGHEVTCIVRDEKKAKLLGESGISLVRGDVTEKGSLKKAVGGNDVVYHMAAIRGERNLPERAYWDVNVKGTRNLLESSMHEGVKRFVFCSTTGVLGWPEKLPANENTPPKPNGLYHRTKYEAEKLVREFDKNGLAATIVRPGITYGPGDRTGMLYRLSKLIKDERYFIIGQGKNFLHLTYVENLLSGFLRVMESDNAPGKTYMMTDRQPITQNDLVCVIARALGKSPPKMHIPAGLANFAGIVVENLRFLGIEPPLTRSKIEVMSKNRFYDISKAERELGYKPEVGTEEGVERTMEWFVENGWL